MSKIELTKEQFKKLQETIKVLKKFNTEFKESLDPDLTKVVRDMDKLGAPDFIIMKHLLVTNKLIPAYTGYMLENFINQKSIIQK